MLPEIGSDKRCQLSRQPSGKQRSVYRETVLLKLFHVQYVRIFTAMPQNPSNFKALSLFTDQGERKYLSSVERERFLNAINTLPNPFERSFCEMLFWSGCRISEALNLTMRHIDLDDNMVIIRSLKKRGYKKDRHFRPVPLPPEFISQLNEIHEIKELQHQNTLDRPLWPFGRTKGWRIIKTVMTEAGITGVRATGRALRHSFGVHAVLSQIPETRIKKWLGHASLSTTEIYLDFASREDHALAERMWS